MLLSQSVVSRRGMWLYLLLQLVAAACATSRAGGQENAPKANEPMRIIVFGAHPDDCELEAGGTAARWAKLGYKVKFVSVTNGDIGHHQMAGAHPRPAAYLRLSWRVKKCASRFWESKPKCSIYMTAALLADPGESADHHSPDPGVEGRSCDRASPQRLPPGSSLHRNLGSGRARAFMVIVPSFCPDVPALRKNPVFLYTEDDFKKPNPFSPDIVVPIDPVFDLKVACIDALESQFYEWNPWLFGYLAEVPKEKTARLDWMRDRVAKQHTVRWRTGSAPS